MAIIINVDGSEEDLPKPTLETMQKAVGGYIELVRVHSVNGVRNMYVNEDGTMLQLRYNHKASTIAGMVLIGNAVLLDFDETRKEESDV